MLLLLPAGLQCSLMVLLSNSNLPVRVRGWECNLCAAAATVPASAGLPPLLGVWTSAAAA